MSSDSPKEIVLALVAQNENEALKTASIGIGWHLERHYRHKIIDLYQPSALKELLTILREDRVAFAYGLAGTGSRLEVDGGVNLWTAARVPFAALWHDHPCYNYRQHIVDSPYVFHCYHVRDHLEARQKHLPPSSSRAVLLPLPYGIDVHEKSRPMSIRINRILYAKTALPPDLWAEDWKRHPPQLQSVLHALAEQAKKDRNLDLADAAETLFEQGGMDRHNLDLFMSAIQEVDVYIRGWRSDRLARALLPFPADIIGRGWDYLRDLPRKAALLPATSSYEYWNQVCAHRITANSSPLWRDGIHERAWMGITSGAVTLTDRTEKSGLAFKGLPNYVGFEWDDDLQDVIATALRLAEKDEADYLPEASATLPGRMHVNTDDYVGQLIQVALKIRGTT